MSFFKKHYKKFLIFCSLAILGFTFIFTKPNKVSAYGINTTDTSFAYSPVQSYVDFSMGFNDIKARIDFPFTYSSSPFSYSLTGSINGISFTLPISQMGLPVSSSDIYSYVGFTGFQLHWSRGPFSIYYDSVLFDPSASDSLNSHSPFYVLIETSINDTIICEYSFDYLLYNDNNSFTSHTYTGSISLTQDQNGYLAFFIIEDFIDSLALDYQYYYFYNIYFGFSSDTTDTVETLVSFPLTTDSYFDNYQSFIDLNGFDLGLTESELDAIYNEGYADGVDSVDTQEYYNDGYTHASEDFLKFENLVFGVMNGFSNTIRQLLDFEIFDISIFALIGGLVAVAFGVGITIIVIKVIKIFT